MSRLAELHTSVNHFVFGNPVTRGNTQKPCELRAYDGNMLEFEAHLLISKSMTLIVVQVLLG